MRIAVHTFFRAWDVYHLQHTDCFFPRLFFAQMAMDAQAFHNLFADGHGRVQRGHRVLENNRTLRTAEIMQFSFTPLCNILTSEFAQFFFVQRQYVLAVAGDLGAFLDDSERWFEQAQDGFCCYGFAAARLSNKGEGLASVQLKADAADCLDLTRIGVEGYAEVFYF